MIFADQESGSFKRFGGLGIVLLLHVLLFYALVTGLAKTVIDVVQKPIEAKIITEEVKPPPEPPKPPPPKAVTPPPSLPFVPPPEVATQAPPQPEQMATTSTPQPADPAPASSDSAPDSTAHAAPAPAFADLNSCKPDYPKAALMAEETGTVRVRFVIGANSQLVSASVLKSSGHRDLDKATVDGLSRCQFKAAMQDGSPIESSFTSDYVWRMD